MKQRLESLELQLSTSVKQAAFLAMESQYSLKQGEVKRLNESIEAMR